MRTSEKNGWVGMAIASGLVIFPAHAWGASSGGAEPRDCSTISAPLGPRPVDRATVMQTMQKVQSCFSQEAVMQKPSSRYGLTLLLLILACVGALAIAGLLFWQVKYMLGMSVPLAIGVAILTIVAANLVDDGPGDRARVQTDRVEQAKWHWTVRMTRSNQMGRDQDAIEEAIAATNEFVGVAMDGRR